MSLASGVDTTPVTPRGPPQSLMVWAEPQTLLPTPYTVDY